MTIAQSKDAATAAKGLDEYAAAMARIVEYGAYPEYVRHRRDSNMPASPRFPPEASSTCCTSVAINGPRLAGSPRTARVLGCDSSRLLIMTEHNGLFDTPVIVDARAINGG